MNARSLYITLALGLAGLQSSALAATQSPLPPPTLTPSAPEAPAASASAGADAPKPRTRRVAGPEGDKAGWRVLEDDDTRIEERVERGAVREIRVQPKNAPAYEVLVPQPNKIESGLGRTPTAGQRVWRVGSF